MTPKEALHNCRRLLNSTDALLSGMITMAQQLREATAILAEVVEEIPAVSITHNKSNGDSYLTLDELHEHCEMAGIRIAKSTLNQYACARRIPFHRAPDGGRRFLWLEVLESMRDNKKRMKGKQDENDSTGNDTVPVPINGGSSRRTED